MKKRLLSILLVLAMVLSLAPMVLATGEVTSSVSFQIQNSNGCSGAVSYKFSTQDSFTIVSSNGSVEVPSGAVSITVKAIPDGEGQINQSRSGIEVNGSSIGGVDFTALQSADGYTYALTADAPQFRIEFDNNDGTGGGGGGGGDHGGDDGGDHGGPRPTDWAALQTEVNNYLFAYGPAAVDAGTEEDMLKAGIAAELYARKMGNGPSSSDKSLGMALGYDPEGGSDTNTAETAIAAMITITGDRHSADEPVNLPYYDFAVDTGEAIDTDDDVAGTQPFTASGRVYVLANAKQFIVKTTVFNDPADPSITYTPVDGPTEAFQNVYFYADYSDGRPGSDTVEVFGNGAMFNGIYAEDPDVTAGHLTQDHAGSLNTFEMGTRLVVTRVPDTVHIQSTNDAAAWSFTDAGVYNAEGTASDPVNATIFFGSDTITLSTATGSKTVTNVEPVDLPADAVTFEGGTLTFHTNYDEIKVKVTYDDETTGYILLNRVGLYINATDNNRSGETGFVTAHGSDHMVRYNSIDDGDNKVIYASFYYDDATFIADGSGKAAAVESHYEGISNKVSLFVTVTMKNGSVTTQVISAPITYAPGAFVAENGGMDLDDNPNNVIGYAGQGNNHFYDDFVLWHGSGSDFSNIRSVSAIVYNPGTADTFGGVQVGSGAGVLWENN